MKLIAVLTLFLIGSIKGQDGTPTDIVDPIAKPEVDWLEVSFNFRKCWELWPKDPTANSLIGCDTRGMTWGWYRHDCNFSIDKVGCGGIPAAPTTSGSCDAYNGDTYSKEKRPILCLNKQWINRPPYWVDCGPAAMNGEFYCGWTGGFYKLTPPIQGCRLTSPGQADQFCRYYFGCHWQMAEHHDGYWLSGMSTTALFGNTWAFTYTGGWAAFGYSNISNQCSAFPVNSSRFWVKINDQNANCWKN